MSFGDDTLNPDRGTYDEGFESGRKSANTALLKALRDAPEPAYIKIDPVDHPRDYLLACADWYVTYRKWYTTVRAEALKLAGGGE